MIKPTAFGIILKRKTINFQDLTNYGKNSINKLGIGIDENGLITGTYLDGQECHQVPENRMEVFNSLNDALIIRDISDTYSILKEKQDIRFKFESKDYIAWHNRERDDINIQDIVNWGKFNHINKLSIKLDSNGFIEKISINGTPAEPEDLSEEQIELIYSLKNETTKSNYSKVSSPILIPMPHYPAPPLVIPPIVNNIVPIAANNNNASNVLNKVINVDLAQINQNVTPQEIELFRQSIQKFSEDFYSRLSENYLDICISPFSAFISLTMLLPALKKESKETLLGILHLSGWGEAKIHTVLTQIIKRASFKKDLNKVEIKQAFAAVDNVTCSEELKNLLKVLYQAEYFTGSTIQVIETIHDWSKKSH